MWLLCSGLVGDACSGGWDVVCGRYVVCGGYVVCGANVAVVCMQYVVRMILCVVMICM